MIFHDCVIHPDVLQQNSSLNFNASKLILLLNGIKNAGMLTQISPSELSLENLNIASQFIREYLELLAKTNRINESLFSTSLTYEEWCQNSKSLHDKYLMDLIVVPNVCNASFEAIDSIDIARLIEISQWGLGESFKQTEEEMVNNLFPILRYAKEVIIIDPWCNLTLKHYQNSLQIIAKQYMSSVNSTLKEDITINAKWVTDNKKNTTTELYKDETRIFCEKMKDEYGVIVKVFLWSNNPDKEFFWHDRSLITNQCAIGIGDGINIQDKKHLKDSTWSILSDKEREKRLDIFSTSKAIRKAKLELYYDGESWKEAKELNRKQIIKR
jgi:hypothetical protein